jgi:DNA uptake protein ComE-like DNA-binding protein
MATITKALFRGAATTTVGTTLYTVPASTTTVISNIVVVNTASSAATFDLALDGVKLATTQAIAANSSAYFDLKQVLATTKIIAGGASAVTVNFHISGVEIS